MALFQIHAYFLEIYLKVLMLIFNHKGGVLNMLSNQELEITKDIQAAIDNTATTTSDQSSAAFLNYITNDFRTEASLVSSDLNTIWLEYFDEGPCPDKPNCRRIRIGNKTFPNQHRTHRHGQFDVRIETRSVRGVAYIDFSHPDIDDIWGDVKACAIGAAVVAVAAAIIAGDVTTARTLFYPSFYACLVAKLGERAKEVDVVFSSDKEYSCWKYHCD
ncbi:hypothetical protein [Bacillus halotolerans]|uniref:hypothetical protein n=1 Tax=Bacillus halotolerans TaxID=260554 RepID=UPI001BFFE544|nr:hypothetical protein [Bacillus halotolerans]MBT9250312.1 hypothetical protein [Bacillus halotolerans]